MRSNLHRQLQEAVKDYYQQKGWIAIVEHYVKGKKIDVLAQNSEKFTIANEIQLTPKHCVENIKLDFKAGCNEVHIISPDKKILEQQIKRASQKLNKNILSKVKFIPATEFIPYIKIIKTKRIRRNLIRNKIRRF